MNSILQTEKECFICRLKYNEHNPRVEEHHIYEGTANRSISEKNGFKVWLCYPHHNDPSHGVHHIEELNDWLKAICQKKYEETHSRQDFMDLIGRNYDTES